MLWRHREPWARDRLEGVLLPLRVPSGPESRGLTTTPLGNTGPSLRGGRGTTPTPRSWPILRSPEPVADAVVPRRSIFLPIPARAAFRPAGVTHLGRPDTYKDSEDSAPERSLRSENLAEQPWALALKPTRLRPRQRPPPHHHWLCLPRGGACGTPGA